MAGFDAQFCMMLENQFLVYRKAIDLIIILPEQYAEKITSWCYRINNISFGAIIAEINYWREQISKLKDIIKNSKMYKNVTRICNDMFRCQALFELVVGNKSFGGKTAEELKADVETFKQYVCNGKLLEAAEALLDKYIGIANTFIQMVKTFIDAQVSIVFNFLMAQYQAVLKVADIPSKLEKLDSIADCIFGVCNVGASVVNYKTDTITRLKLNPNGQADKNAFTKILQKGLDKIDSGITSLDNDITDAQNWLDKKQNNWHKVAKDAVSNSLPKPKK